MDPADLHRPGNTGRAVSRPTAAAIPVRSRPPW
jgi:hypothetical protein